MGDCIATKPLVEGEEDLIASMQNIMETLQSMNLTKDARKTLANLGLQLFSITRDTENEEESKEDDGFSEIKQQLDNIRGKIMKWETDQSMIWDCGPNEAFEYLKAVDEARKLTEILDNRSPDSTEGMDLLRQAHDVLQTAMSRLEDEFRNLLVQNRNPFELEYLSFRSNEDDIIDDRSVVSFGDDSIDDVSQRESMGRSSEGYIIELVQPDIIPDLKSIANLMFDSDYGRECSQVFINVQKDALDDCLFILEVEKLSIEDVLKMEWNVLNSKIKRWIRAMKRFVRVYLASEKLLSDQIFGELETVSSACFAESSKTAFLQLLNFGEAIAIGPHKPEKLIRILDMFEVLNDLIPDITPLYSNETGSSVITECQDILKRLGDCAKATFLEFEDAVKSNVSSNAFSGGGVHPLTKYVMNYTKTLMDYRKTLDEVLKDEEEEEYSISHSPDQSPEEENTSNDSPDSPMVQHFRSLISKLERNIDEKSNMYRDESLQHLFLMNNVHYMTEKVKRSEVRTVLGDEWIRKHIWKFQQHAMGYERATWSSILALLRDEGIQNPSSNSVSRTILKERLQSFYLAFEEVYKSQTGWLVRDSELREDLQTSTSNKVIHAYRTFVGRHQYHISEKHIKYSADELGEYLMDLFVGTQKSLHGSYKK